jgi:hypothetical protein
MQTHRTATNEATDAVVRITTSTICGTDRFALADAMKAYDTFGNAAKEGALKVILKAEPVRTRGTRTAYLRDHR